MEQAVVAGSFDAEGLWRDPQAAGLPAIRDPDMEQVARAMDELLFLLCEKDDVLLTQTPFHPALKHYFQGFGWQFGGNTAPLPHTGNALGNVFEGLASLQEIELDSMQNGSPVFLRPFACLPGMKSWCKKSGLSDCFPSLDCIRKVNSKCFSHELRLQNGWNYGCVLVNSAAELCQEGERLLSENHTGVIVKDPMGVSGKGNLAIQSPAVLKRIGRLLQKQEDQGKVVRFLLEPRLEKEMDFACAVFLDEAGRVDVRTLQGMDTTGLAYSGSERLDADKRNRVEASGYFTVIEQACRALHQAGYFGDVCFDSMLLLDGHVVPIVEINARVSMTLLKHRLDGLLEPFAVASRFGYCQTSLPSSATGADLLDYMQQAGLLFTPNQCEGIVPLSMKTLNLNRPEAVPGLRRGRLYYAALSKEQASLSQLQERLEGLLEQIKRQGSPT